MTASNDNSYDAARLYYRRRELRGFCLCCFVVLALVIALATTAKSATIPAGTVLSLCTVKVNLADETITASKRIQFQLARPLVI